MTELWYDTIDLRSGWHWHCLSGEVKNFLCGQGAAELVWVKRNSDRAVARCGDFFLKFNRLPLWKALFFSPAREEFQAACRLRRARIPTVEHLGYARKGGVTLLITRAWHPDACNVDDFWSEHMVLGSDEPTEFLAAFAEFFAELLAKNLYHPDFHLGNILWSPGAREFTLVDLHRVSVRPTRTVAEKLFLLEVLPKFREAAAPAIILQLIQVTTGLSEAATGQLLRHLLAREQQAILRQWARRKAQFLAGYPKFSAIASEGGQSFLIRRDRLRRPMFDPKRREEFDTEHLSPENAVARMLFSFYLQLLRIPHRPVAAVAADGTVYLARLDGDRPAPRDAVNAFNEYLLCFGLTLDDYQAWRQMPGGRIVIGTLQPMLEAVPDRAMFQGEWRGQKTGDAR